MSPPLPSRALVSSQSETTRSSRIKRTARQARREDSLAKTSLRGGKAPRGIANDARLGPLITKQENDRRPARLLLSVRRFARSAYFFRRLLITSKAPESRVRALALEPGSISGTAEASAAPDTPTSSKNIPTSF